MTQETQNLSHEINEVRKDHKQTVSWKRLSDGYSTTLSLLTDLFGCVLVGVALGFFVHIYLGASILWVAGLTVLGGVAGLWTVVRYAMNQDRKGK